MKPERTSSLFVNSTWISIAVAGYFSMNIQMEQVPGKRSALKEYSSCRELARRLLTSANLSSEVVKGIP